MTHSADWTDKPGTARSPDFVCVGTSLNDHSEKNPHPAQYPVDLARWIIKLLCPKDGTVLDPFMGSGSTGIAAISEGRSFYGIEQNAEYFTYAKKRIESCQVNK